MGLEKDQYHELRELFRHHIESFDYFIDAGLDTVIKSIRPIEIRDSASGQKIRNILFYCLSFVFCCCFVLL